MSRRRAFLLISTPLAQQNCHALSLRVIPQPQPIAPVWNSQLRLESLMRMALPTGNQISAALKSVPLFAGLDERQIGSLARHAVARRSEPGEMIFVEGDECQGLYVVFSGAIKIFKESSQGREQVLTVERSGGVVAELPVFDGGPYPASCSPI